MEKETDELLYNCTNCLRKEYKALVDLKRSFGYLEIYINNRIEQINQYDNTPHQSKETEHPNDIAERVYIDDVRMRLGRAQKYIKQIEEEINRFPTHPELPPTKPLIKLSGILGEVSFKKVIGYFEYTEYSTEKKRAEEKLKRDNSGAVLLAILSFFANSTSPNLLKDGKKKEYRCLYVKGKIDGKSFSGWLNKTDIQVGDYLEMAVIPDGDEYKMYAVANPQKQTISTTPGCSVGSRWFTVKSVIKFPAIFFAFIIFLPSAFSSLTLTEWGYALLMHLSLTGAFSFALYRGLANDSRSPGELFERICTALSIPDGKSLGLQTYTTKVIKEKKAKGVWVEPENEDIVIPQRRHTPDYSFYYYPPSKKVD